MASPFVGATKNTSSQSMPGASSPRTTHFVRFERAVWRAGGVAFGQPIFRGDNLKTNVGVVERLRRGETIALVSDAGTPTVSDPGADLVAVARAEGITVVPVAGPTPYLPVPDGVATDDTA